MRRFDPSDLLRRAAAESRRHRPTGAVAGAGLLAGVLLAQTLGAFHVDSAAIAVTAPVNAAAEPPLAGPAVTTPVPEAPPTAVTGASSTTTTAATTTAPPQTTTTAPATTTTAPPPRPQAVVPRSTVPTGKGMWIWEPTAAHGSHVPSIVQTALRNGLTHIYVRTGSSWKGFYAGQFLNALLPYAHDRGVRVYGWDFPTLNDVDGDIARAMQAIRWEAPGRHRIDGFVPDLETPSEGTNSTPERVRAYTHGLRARVGNAYALVGCVPRPSESLLARGWPFAEAIAPMSAVAPMVYWLNRQPDTDVAGAIAYLERFGKPIIPVGQAYDGGPEGGRPGPPPADEIARFTATAAEHGATGVSFWSWQHATPEIWATIRDAPAFTAAPTEPPAGPAGIRAVQRSLIQLGYPTPASGRWDAVTTTMLARLQRTHGLEITGALDEPTREVLRRAGFGL